MLIQAAGAAPTLRARHRNLLNNMADANLRWLTEATNTDEQGKDRPCYHMTRDGLALLAMGFTGAKALAFKVRCIKAFNRMEATGEAPQRITKADLGRQTAAIIAAQMSPVVKLLESSERRLAALEKVMPGVRLHSSLGHRPPAPETVPMAGLQISSGAGPATMVH